MEKPYGVLPSDFLNYVNSPYVIYKEYGEIINYSLYNRYYQFFVFDKRSCIIILSKSPLNAIKIDSNKFYNHLLDEFNGIITNQKRNNTIYYYEKVGPYEIGIMFAPNEIKRWDGDKRLTLIKDLIKSASKITMFSVDMRDETLYSDVTYQKKYSIFYPDNISTLFNGKKVSNNIGFSFIVGQEIQINESLLKNFRGYSLNTYDLKKDFFICFSSPIGKDSGSVYDGNYFKSNKGNYSIVLVIKGNLYDKIIPFLTSKGFDFKVNLGLKFDIVNGKPTIFSDYLGSFTVYYSIDNINYNFLTEFTGLSCEIPIEPGYYYNIKVIDNNSLEEDNISFIYPKKAEVGDIRITEVLWMGSTDGFNNFYSDEFIEIKNVSGKYIDISNLNLYIKGSLQLDSNSFNSLGNIYKIIGPDKYFLIINSKDYLFSSSGFNLDMMNLKYIASTSLSISNTFPYYIELKDNIGNIIDNVYMNGSFGYNSLNLKKSMVLKTYGWSTSSYNLSDNIFSLYTYSTPGFRDEDEF